MTKHTYKKVSAFLLTAAIAATAMPTVSFAADDDTQYHYGTYDVVYTDQNGNILEPDLIPDNLISVDKENSAVNSSYFNLADEGRVTSVKSQSPLGSCWAHAGIAAAESSMITKGLATSDVDYSEQHLMWFSNGQGPTDPSDPLYGDCGLNYGTDCYDAGGTIYSVMGALTSWQGVQLEENAPYADAVALKELPESQRYVSYGHAREILMYDASDIASIKSALVNIGACSLSYYDNSQYFNSANSAYYCNTSHSTNHAVTLVGWDDNYSKENFNSGTQPSSDGAWILKNSWDTWWGDEGYFYMSYEDATASKITSIEMDTNTNYTDIYQYDASIGLEKVNSTSISVNIFNYGTAFQGANIFTAKNDNPLTAIGFYTFDAETPYEVRIYTDVDTIAKTGTLAYSDTGTFTYGGFHTLDLDEAVELTEGEKFAISVIYTDADKARVAFDYKGADGTSYMTWIEEGANYSWRDANQKEGCGVCIKGYTTAPEPATPATPTNVTASEINGEINITWDKVDGAKSYRLYRATSETGEKSLVISTNTNSVIDGNAEYGTTYYYFVQAYNSETAVSDYSVPASAMRTYLPAPVVSVVNVNGVNTKISWDAVDGATLYCVYRADSPTGEKVHCQTGAFENLSYTDNDASLKQGTTYYYFVKAASGYYESEFSAAAGATTEDIAAPVITSATATDTEITLTWTSVEGATRYFISRADSANGEKTLLGNSSALSYVDNTAEFGKTYYYFIQANSTSPSLTSLYSEPISVSISTLATPVITGANVDDTSVTLTWNTVGNATSYRLYRANTATGEKTLLKTVSSTSCIDATAEAGNTYYYFVVAYNSAHNISSDFSAEKCVNIPAAVLGTPTITDASANGTTITLKWDAVEGATSYRIYRANSETGTKAHLKTVGITSCNDTTVKSGNTYYYFVQAYSSKTTLLSDFSAAYAVDVPGITAPIISSANTSGTTVTLKWNTVESATSYRIYRADSLNGEKALLKSVGITSCNDTTAKAGGTYYYFVQAYNSKTALLSEYSEPKMVSLDGLYAPTITSASSSGTTVSLYWNSVNGATSYRIYRANSETGSKTHIKTVGITSCLDSTAVAGNTYYYFVQAYNSKTGVLSAYSAAESVTIAGLAAPKFNAHAITNGVINLSWNTVEGATSYRIYRATSQTGTRTLLKTVGITSCNDTTAESGNTYYYYVQAYSSKTGLLSEYSTVKIVSMCTELTAPTAISIDISNNDNGTVTATLKWSAVNGATSYRIYRATSENGTKSLLKAVGITSCADTVSSGTYYYFVAAYNSATGSMSEFSDYFTLSC